MAMHNICQNKAVSLSLWKTSIERVRLLSVATLCMFAPLLYAATSTIGVTPGSYAVSASGAATYNIPIEIPPGVGGVQPSISLSYSSQRGNGVVGVGWSISGLSAITRCAAAPDRAGSNGGFCLDGQRLVLISAGTAYGSNGTEYRTEIESFSKITAIGTTGSGPTNFTVKTKTGQLMEYGNGNGSQQYAIGNSTIVAWHINKMQDSLGNYIEFVYNTDSATTGEHRIDHINYTMKSGAAVGGVTRKLQFNYENRSDIESRSSYGATLKTTKRLLNIQTWLGASLVRTYNVTYDSSGTTSRSRLIRVQPCGADGVCLSGLWFNWNPTTASTYAVGSYASTADTCLTCGSWQTGDVNGDGKTDLIHITTTNGLVYTWLANGNNTYTVTSMTSTVDTCLQTCGSWKSGDVNGDGKADLIHITSTNGLVYTWLSNGNGSYTVTSMTSTADPCVQKCGSWEAGDVNGDGRTDLLHIGAQTNLITTWVSNGNGTYTVVPTLVSTDTCLSCGTWKSGDLNGDGRTDLIHLTSTSGLIYSWFSSGSGSFFIVPMTSSADSCIQGCGTWEIGDINGDGKSDLLHFTNTAGLLRTWSSRGNGVFDVVSYTSSTDTCLPSSPTCGIWKVADSNGDGKDDLVHITNTAGVVRTWISNGSGAYNVISQTTSDTCMQTCGSWQVGDVTGDGTIDLIHVTNTSGTAKTWQLKYSLDLLQTVTNALGAQTVFGYLPLTTGSTFYSKDTDAVYPVQDVQSADYFVNSVSVSDGMHAGVSYSSHHSYAGLKRDLGGRGELGFRSVTTYIAGGRQNTTVYSQTWPFIGMPVQVNEQAWSSTKYRYVTVMLKQNYLASAEWNAGIWASTSSTPSIVSSPTTIPASVALTPPGTNYFSKSACSLADGTRTCLPFVDWSYTVNYDVNSTAAYMAGLSDSGNPDRYGNVATTSDTTYDGYKSTTTRYFSNDTTNWRLGLMVAKQEASTVPAAYSNTGTAQTQTRTELRNYDSYGRLVRAVIEPESGSYTLSTGTYNEPATAPTPYLTLITEYAFDATYGFVNTETVRGKDIATRKTTTAYVNGTNPGSANPQVQIANAMNHTQVTTFDARFGVATSTRGPNNLPTSWSYDGFGRKVGESRADGTSTSITTTSCTGVCYINSTVKYAAYKSVTNVKNSSGVDIAPPVTVYFDLLGREVRTETAGFSGAAIYQDTIYDASFRVATVSRPYFASGSSYVVVYAYDGLDRLISVTEPDGAATTTTYNGLSTTVTAPSSSDGKIRKRTETKNSAGQLVSVTERGNGVDSYNTITYRYDALGLPAKVTTTGSDGKTTTVTSTFDLRGRKTATNDPDMGNWTYGYNVLGELTSQTDAKNQTATLKYDLLGRMTDRIESEGTSTWTYDTSANGKGKLAKVTGPTNGYTRTYIYDTLSRPSIVGTTINSVTYNMSVGYDAANGRVTNVQFPSTVAGVNAFAFFNNYTPTGFLSSVSSLANNGGTVYWKVDANGIDAEGRVISQTLGNGTNTKHTYDPITELLSDIDTTGPKGIVQDSHYTYYTGVYNLNTRSSAVAGAAYSETFTYDELNRVLTANVSGSAGKSFVYDSLGNITSKTGVGTYAYGSATVRPHAVSGVTGTVNGVVNPTYGYDNNGNLTTGAGRTMGYTSFNLPKSVTTATVSQSYAYDAEHQRIVMTEGASNTTIYINPRWDAGVHFEKETKGKVDEYKHYIYAGGSPVAMYVVKRDNGANTTTNYTRYFHTDHLGSMDVITKEDGSVVERLGYDAWGKRRNANGTDATTQLTSTVTHHGYTGHEMIDSIGLINMNGRWYDPTLGRFMQADPTIDGATTMQGYNRYSYVSNNPLSMTDPSGYKKFWKKKSWTKKWTKVRGALKVGVGAALIYASGVMLATPFAGLAPAVFAAGASFVASGACDTGATCQLKEKMIESGWYSTVGPNGGQVVVTTTFDGPSQPATSGEKPTQPTGGESGPGETPTAAGDDNSGGWIDELDGEPADGECGGEIPCDINGNAVYVGDQYAFNIFGFYSTEAGVDLGMFEAGIESIVIGGYDSKANNGRGGFYSEGMQVGGGGVRFGDLPMTGSIYSGAFVNSNGEMDKVRLFDLSLDAEILGMGAGVYDTGHFTGANINGGYFFYGSIGHHSVGFGLDAPGDKGFQKNPPSVDDIGLYW